MIFILILSNCGSNSLSTTSKKSSSSFYSRSEAEKRKEINRKSDDFMGKKTTDNFMDSLKDKLAQENLGLKQSYESWKKDVEDIINENPILDISTDRNEYKDYMKIGRHTSELQ